jgi:hypothetical protein
MVRFVAHRDGSFEAAADDLPTTTRATMPADWSETFGAGFLGRVRYVRSFQTPTGLEPGDKVWLVVEPPRSFGVVCLSDHPLGTVQSDRPAGRFDITSLLAERNLLEVFVEHPALDDGRPLAGSDVRIAGGLVGEVRLEIEAVG